MHHIHDQTSAPRTVCSEGESAPRLRAAPLASGSVSFGLSAVGERASEVVSRLESDARAAVDAGFDGVTISEHHDGFPGYFPHPVTLAATLRERLAQGWAVAAPSVLPLRNPVLLAEELAWGHALHPGRVAAAFVPGYQAADFDLMGLDFHARHRTHWEHLDHLLALLRGEVDSGDQALRDLALARECSGRDEVTVLTGAAGPIAVRRAAQAGVGLLLPSLRPATEVSELVARYRDHGGEGPVVMIRRVAWGGDLRGSHENRRRWASRAEADWLDLDDDALAAGSSQQVVEALLRQVAESGCTALNLRLESYASAPDRVSDELAAVGEEVLPRLRAELGW